MRSNTKISSDNKEWLRQINASLPEFLQTLESPDQVGRFSPCADGVTEYGSRIQLGFSCFAAKIFYTIGRWDLLPGSKRHAWTSFINSFQVDERSEEDKISSNAFIDPVIVRNAYAQIRYPTRLLQRLFPPKGLTHPQRVILAETKQALATLAMVGESPERPFRGFPVNVEGVSNHLRQLDWTKPWGAGGQASALVVFVKTQAPATLEEKQAEELVTVCRQFFSSIADQHTGSYFVGRTPEHGQLINGAMKVLTALDWLEARIHYPEQLVDTCLGLLPNPDGCHLVDAVYVLYRCSQQTDYKRDQILDYCIRVLGMIRNHYNADGGFSYSVGRSQTHYYNARPISRGHPVSDIHGTCLLTWALSMIVEIMGENRSNWKVMTP